MCTLILVMHLRALSALQAPLEPSLLQEAAAVAEQIQQAVSDEIGHVKEELTQSHTVSAHALGQDIACTRARDASCTYHQTRPPRLRVLLT